MCSVKNHNSAFSNYRIISPPTVSCFLSEAVTGLYSLLLFLVGKYLKQELFKEISKTCRVTELPPVWERVANYACHLIFLWLFNCICLYFPFVVENLIWI